MIRFNSVHGKNKVQIYYTMISYHAKGLYHFHQSVAHTHTETHSHVLTFSAIRPHLSNVSNIFIRKRIAMLCDIIVCKHPGE